MALHLDLDPGDILVVPPDSGAQIRITEKTGRRVRVAVESAKPVHVLRARDAQRPGSTTIPKPRPTQTSGRAQPPSPRAQVRGFHSGAEVPYESEDSA